MKLLKFWKRRRPGAGRPGAAPSTRRQCQFEEMEMRRLCAVDPLAVGLLPAKEPAPEEMVQLPVSEVVNPALDGELGENLDAVIDERAAGIVEELLLGSEELTSKTEFRQQLEFPVEVVFPSPSGFPPVVVNTSRIPFYGSSNQVPRAWHLSVINAGSPPYTEAGLASNRDGFLSDWSRHEMASGKWQLGQQAEPVQFGMPDAVPVVGDWNGDGVEELGVFHRGRWYLDLNGNKAWDDEDLWVELGEANDLPVVGDWDGDGKDDIGVLAAELPADGEPGEQEIAGRDQGTSSLLPRQRSMRVGRRGEIRRDTVDHVFRHGMSRDLPVAGDWNGNGVDTIGAFRDGRWRLDTNGDGRLDEEDQQFSFGRAGDRPVVGDWDGDGIDQIGIVRNGSWMLDSNGSGELDLLDQVFGLGDVTENPLAGDWNGDGIDQPGVYRPSFTPPTDQGAGR